MSVPVKKNDDATPARRQGGDTPSRSRAQSDRELAKLGLIATTALLVATGLSRTRAARRMHILAGGVFIGLGVWHHMLYAPSRPAGKNPAKKDGADG